MFGEIVTSLAVIRIALWFWPIEQKGRHQIQKSDKLPNHYKLTQAVLNKVIAEYETYTVI